MAAVGGLVVQEDRVKAWDLRRLRQKLYGRAIARLRELLGAAHDLK